MIKKIFFLNRRRVLLLLHSLTSIRGNILFILRDLSSVISEIFNTHFCPSRVQVFIHTQADIHLRYNGRLKQPSTSKYQ